MATEVLTAGTDIPPRLDRERPLNLAVLAEGAITPLGLSAGKTWEKVQAMESGIVEHRYPPFTEPIYDPPRAIISEMIGASSTFQRLIDRFGNTPTVRNFIFDEYLAEHPDIRREDIRMTKLETQIKSTTAGTIKGFNAVELLVDTGFLPRSEVVNRLDPYALYGLAASFEALRKVRTIDGVDLLIPRLKEDGVLDRNHQWTINPELVHPLFFTTFAGTGFGGGDVTAQVDDKLKMGLFPDEHMMRSLNDRAASANTQASGGKGGAEADTAACDSSGKALLNAALRINQGLAQMALVEGTEGVLGKPYASAMFDAMGALDRGDDPLKVSRSLHRIRKGFTMAEGAVAFVIADYDYAVKMKLPVLYRIIGVGDTSGAGHNTDPNSFAQEQAMRLVRRMAQWHGPVINRGKVIVVGHFTGTLKGEVSETNAIKNSMSDLQDRTYLYGPKRLAGHMLGAAGNYSMLVAGKALQERIIPGMLFDGDSMEEAEGWKISRETHPDSDLTEAEVNQFGFGDANTAYWLTQAS